MRQYAFVSPAPVAMSRLCHSTPRAESRPSLRMRAKNASSVGADIQTGADPGLSLQRGRQHPAQSAECCNTHQWQQWAAARRLSRNCASCTQERKNGAICAAPFWGKMGYMFMERRKKGRIAPPLFVNSRGAERDRPTWECKPAT